MLGSKVNMFYELAKNFHELPFYTIFLNIDFLKSHRRYNIF